jgi:integrase/recombinase XerD
MNDLVPTKASRTAVSISGNVVIPAAIADAGEHAVRRFLEFFAATIRNRNTREAYYRAACSFFAWLEQYDIGELADIEPMHVSLYIETLLATAA